MRRPGQIAYPAPRGRCVNSVPEALFGIRQCGQGFGFYSLIRAVLVWRYTLYSSWAFAGREVWRSKELPVGMIPHFSGWHTLWDSKLLSFGSLG